ncbi:MAG: glutathione S-transferase family protein [Alphaproteobacteria bacterium]|nr:glutathione S-transferase family protein [Alphaproteobacteria bacterium]
MTTTLYELLADGDRLISPYCWRTRFALPHKGLDATLIPIKFTEKEKIAFSGQDKVPVITDGEKVVFDSWTIACHLEDAYPDRPTLFGGDVGRALARFINSWGDKVQNPMMGSLIIFDVFQGLCPEDKAYFQKTREQRFGKALAEVQKGREERVAGFRSALEPVRSLVAEQPFISGKKPAYADYIVMGGFMWARNTSSLKLLEPNDPVFAWRDRMLDAFDGMAAGSNGLTV